MNARPKSGHQRHVPFVEHLGIVREHAERGESRVSIELRPELLNNHAGGHGGVVMTLLDCAMAHAALSRIDYAREVVTIDMHVAFMRPAGTIQIFLSRSISVQCIPKISPDARQ